MSSESHQQREQQQCSSTLSKSVQDEKESSPPKSNANAVCKKQQAFLNKVQRKSLKKNKSSLSGESSVHLTKSKADLASEQ